MCGAFPESISEWNYKGIHESILQEIIKDLIFKWIIEDISERISRKKKIIKFFWESLCE